MKRKLYHTPSKKPTKQNTKIKTTPEEAQSPMDKYFQGFGI